MHNFRCRTGRGADQTSFEFICVVEGRDRAAADCEQRQYFAGFRGDFEVRALALRGRCNRLVGSTSATPAVSSTTQPLPIGAVTVTFLSVIKSLVAWAYISPPAVALLSIFPAPSISVDWSSSVTVD